MLFGSKKTAATKIQEIVKVATRILDWIDEVILEAEVESGDLQRVADDLQAQADATRARREDLEREIESATNLRRNIANLLERSA